MKNLIKKKLDFLNYIVEKDDYNNRELSILVKYLNRKPEYLNNVSFVDMSRGKFSLNYNSNTLEIYPVENFKNCFIFKDSKGDISKDVKYFISSLVSDNNIIMRVHLDKSDVKSKNFLLEILEYKSNTSDDFVCDEDIAFAKEFINYLNSKLDENRLNGLIDEAIDNKDIEEFIRLSKILNDRLVDKDQVLG